MEFQQLSELLQDSLNEKDRNLKFLPRTCRSSVVLFVFFSKKVFFQIIPSIINLQVCLQS